MREHDTIAAPATPPGPAARAIVRTSGPRAFELLAALTGSDRPTHAAAVERSARLAPGIDVPATVYAFVGPQSSTGEDVVEYHLPGSPLLVRLLLARLFERGARLAEPGEFTARAFFSGRLDLARAEGVAATIAAASRRDLDAARQLLAGELNRRVAPIAAMTLDALASVEAELDFSDEPVDAIGKDALASRLSAIDAELAGLLASSARFERLAHEPRVALVGRPNAGKSTLLNALAGRERAGVSDVAGTTRDAVSARVELRRGAVVLVDTAGVDDAATTGDVDVLMRESAARERATADAVLLVVPAGETVTDEERAAADLVVRTKGDLRPTEDDPLTVSAHTGAGLEALRDALDVIAFGASGEQGGRRTLALNARHVAAIGRARRHLAEALAARGAGLEVVASSLRQSLSALGEIAGAATPDDVLGKIFGSFCIGK